MSLPLFGASPSHLAIVCGNEAGLYEFAGNTSALEFLRCAVGIATPDEPLRYAELLADLKNALEEFDLTLANLRGDPMQLALPLTAALGVHPGADLRGTCLIAGHDALWVPRDVDSTKAQAVASVWLGHLEPALRLRIYASARTSQLDSFFAFGDNPPQEFVSDLLSGALGGSEFRALHFEEEKTQVVGEIAPGRPAHGRLALSRIIREDVIELGKARLCEIRRLGACSSLSGQSLAAAGEPYDFSTGMGWTRQDAEVRAEGEAIERFSLGHIDHSLLIRSAANELGRTWFDPRSVAALAEEQRKRLQLERFDPGCAETWWIDGLRGDGSVVAAPAALVHMPFPRPRWLHPGFQTTSGVATHTAFTAAAQRAWFELVERDAFLRAWWNRKPLKPIRPPAQERVLLDLLKKKGMSVRLLLLPGSFGVDAVGAIAVGAGRVLIGAAAGELASASGKALMEVVCQLNSRGPEPASLKPSSVRSPGDHAALWSGIDIGERLAWLTEEGDDPLDLPPEGASNQDWQTIKECPDPTAVFVSIPSPIETAFSVVRALSEELVPLSFGYDAEPRAHPQLAGLTWPKKPPWPHPFA